MEIVTSMVERKFRRIALISILPLCSLLAPNQAWTSYKVEVVYHNRPYRAKPDASSELLGRLPKGEQLDVLDRLGNWLRIRLPGPRAYWINRNYVKGVEEQLDLLHCGVVPEEQIAYGRAKLKTEALREAVERISVKVRSYTRVDNMILTVDLAETISAAIVKSPDATFADSEYIPERRAFKICVQISGRVDPLEADEFTERFVKNRSEVLAIEGIDNMAYIPAGGFFKYADGRYTRVTLPAYFIDRYEVQRSAYKRFMFSTGKGYPLGWTVESFADDNLPVVGVTWFDAYEFCSWVKKRLPTEAEWQKAARGQNDRRRWPWGDQFEANRVNMFQTNKYQQSYLFRPKSFPFGVSPYGVYDLIGNVWEWVADAYWGMAQIIDKGERGITPPYRILKGGSWINPVFAKNANNNIHIGLRQWKNPSSSGLTIGFRCAKSIRDSNQKKE